MNRENNTVLENLIEKTKKLKIIIPKNPTIQ